MTEPRNGIYDRGLAQTPANSQPLSPLSLLQWAATAYRDKIAVIHGNVRYRYIDLYNRCRQLASALQQRGVGLGDTVAIMSPNTPAMLEAHYGVPMAGAVLNALNYRLDAETIAFILEHGEARVLLTDREFSPVIKKALALVKRSLLVIDIDDPVVDSGELLGSMSYDEFLQTGDENFPLQLPDDDWEAIALNYTSGTTGNPKGVVYHHKGAYLNALGNAITFGLNNSSVYLWTLPMFHCNGWTFTWGVTGVGGTHVCLRDVDPGIIFGMIRHHGVTHMCGAPIVLNMLAQGLAEQKPDFEQTVEVATGGAAPPTSVITSMEKLGFRVTHLYGLTETYGPAVVCNWQNDWGKLEVAERAARMARQGVRCQTLSGYMVADGETMQPVPADGETMGELMLRGNTVMKGYLKNPEATAEAFRGGWLHTGDLGVMHADGYIEIKDRSKDIIISGGENISSLEVEEVLYKHPQVMEAAVVACPDEKWGEIPYAFITLTPNAGEVTDQDIIKFCRANMAHFKAPRRIAFGPLPKTSTGKIQKFALRARVASPMTIADGHRNKPN